MDLTSHFFPATVQARPCLHIVGRNQYSAEFGLGPLIHGLTYPVQYSSNSSLPVTIRGDGGDTGGGGGGDGGST